MYRLFILLALVDASSFHKFHSGDCPQIDSMNDFQMDKFIGQWYVVQNSNDNLAACLREEFTGTEVAPREMIDMARNELADNGTSYEEPEPFKVYQLKRSYLPFGGRQFIAETGKWIALFFFGHFRSAVAICGQSIVMQITAACCLFGPKMSQLTSYNFN